MSLKNLTKHEQEIVLCCLRASVDGPFFPDWEFSTLFGLSKDEVREVIQRWPINDNSDKTAKMAINGSLNNLLGYPHHEKEAWKEYIPATRKEVHSIFQKWRGEKIEGYFDGLK